MLCILRRRRSCRSLRISLWTLLLLPLVGLPAVAKESSHALNAATEALQVRAGFQVEPVAAEPLIVDPVSARLDHQGRLWVVEMPDYPTGPREGAPPAGRIKILRDNNADGRFDRATVFADGLLFATGIQPYRDGAIITTAGQILFFSDTDGDDVADAQAVWFEGFSQQNEQLRANHPTLGPDGRVYVAGGLRGGLIRAVDPRFVPRAEPLDIRDRDFVFDPQTGDWEAVAGNSQFGLTIDDFGRRIGCSNRNPAMTTPISLTAIERDPLLAPRDAIVDVAAAAEASHVASIAEAWTTSNLHAGQFSAACGVFAPGWHHRDQEWLLVCEPTAYLVQRQRVQRDGSTWKSVREDHPSEFLASSDTWFRPVDVTAGPGDSVYIVDMARAVIEHPDWMPPELKTRADQWDGGELGRIWQVRPVDQSAPLESLSDVDQAVQWLQSDSTWQRQMASEFLLQQPAAVVSAPLQAVVADRSAMAAARARAAFLLQRMDSLESSQLQSLLTADDPRLRALGISLDSDLPEHSSEWLPLATDRDPLVRRQVAAASAAGGQDRARRITALVSIAGNSSDPWIERSIASADQGLIQPLCTALIQTKPVPSSLVVHLIERLAIDQPTEAAAVISNAIDRASDNQPEDKVLVVRSLQAWIAGLRRGKHNVRSTIEGLPLALNRTMQRGWDMAVAMAADRAAPPALRASCLQITADIGRVPQDLRQLIADHQPPEVRMAALPLLLQTDRPWTREYLAEQLPAWTLDLRTTAVAACGRTTDDTLWLLNLIETDQLPKTVVDPTTAKRWQQHSHQEIQSRATKLFQSDPNRVAVLAKYAVAAQQLGDPLLGKKIFTEQCSACHRIDDVGTNVGPDISDSRTKTADVLLASILDPNAAIDAAFLQYNVLTVDGRIIDGLLVDETGDAITLQQKGGQRVSIPRQDIETISAPGVSLMPEGFEQTIDVAGMSHLLAYLKNWRYLRTPIPGLQSSIP